MNEKAGDNSRHNKRLKDLREEATRIRNALDTGKETIHVDCYERINEQLQQVETVRKDTETVLPDLTRPMTSAERQVEAFTDEGQGIDDTEAVEATTEEPKKRRGRKKKSEQAEPSEEAAE
jgi:hypothetical protein